MECPVQTAVGSTRPSRAPGGAVTSGWPWGRRRARGVGSRPRRRGPSAHPRPAAASRSIPQRLPCSRTPSREVAASGSSRGCWWRKPLYLRLETRTAQLLKSPAEDLRDRLCNRRLLDDRGVHGRPVSPEPAPRASGRSPQSPSDFPHVGNTRSRRSAGLHAQLPAKQRGDAVGICKGKGGLAVDDGDTGSRFECTQCSAVRE